MSRATDHGILFNDLAHGALTDLLPADIDQVGNKDDQAAAFRVTVGIKPGGTDSIFSVQISDGATDILFALNSGTALVAGNLYTFTHGTRGDHQYNYQFADITDIGVFYVEEVTTEAL